MVLSIYKELILQLVHIACYFCFQIIEVFLVNSPSIYICMGMSTSLLNIIGCIWFLFSLSV